MAEKDNSETGFISRIGGATIASIENLMVQPVGGEPTEGFMKLIGTSVLGAGAVATMIALDKYTGMGTNPLNYIVPVQFLSTR